MQNLGGWEKVAKVGVGELILSDFGKVLLDKDDVVWTYVANFEGEREREREEVNSGFIYEHFKNKTCDLHMF